MHVACNSDVITLQNVRIRLNSNTLCVCGWMSFVAGFRVIYKDVFPLGKRIFL